MKDQFLKCLALIDRATVWRASGLSVLIILGVTLEVIGIGLIFPFVKLVMDPSLIHQMEWIKTIFRSVPPGGEETFLIVAAFSLMGVFVIKNAILLLVYYGQSRFLATNEALLAVRLFDGYLRGAYSLHLKRNSAALIRTLTGAVHTLFGTTIMAFITLASESVLILALAIVLFIAEPWLTLAAVLSMSITVGIFYVIFRHHFVAWGIREQKANQQILQSLQQGLHSIKETKILGRETFIVEGFARPRRELSLLQTILGAVRNAPRLWVETVMIIGVLLGIVLTLGKGGASGNIFAALALFAAAAFRLIPTMNRIIMALNNVKSGTHAVNLICEDLDSFRRERDSGAGQEEQAMSFTDSLKIEGLSFSYPESEARALHGIDLEIQRGESIGLVGPSGGGKTTLADIILGLLEPTSGRVTVDGIDIADNWAGWRKLLGYVPQDIYLIDDTLRRNIAFGMADGDIDPVKLGNALSLAQLDEFVDGLPDGLDTVLGEHGSRLSGGQRQRVGIARALYRNPAVLIFDEATSSLDSETEHEISRAIEKLSSDKTLIIIAHRLSTVRSCDKVVFLRDGRIIDSGTFEELSDHNPDFARMVELSQL